MNSPRRVSTRVPGLVMWDNGTIVTVMVTDAGDVFRTKQGDPVVRQLHGRWTGGEEHADAVFRAVEERVVVETGRFLRASGDMVCRGCDSAYRRHPTHGDYEWLHRLCDGNLVKL